MNKYDIKALASVLAKAHNISEAAAEDFVKAAFQLIKDALLSDGQVKVKGLGTFKLMRMPERELIDVNSGERITVEARNRISFSPDSVLRDIINKPFIFFDTVVLNDGVTFDDESEIETADDDDDTEEVRITDDASDDNAQSADESSALPVVDDMPSEPQLNDKVISADEHIEEDTPAHTDDSHAESSSEENVSTDTADVHTEPELSAPPVAVTAPDEEKIVSEEQKAAPIDNNDNDDANDDSSDDDEEEVHGENRTRRKIWISFIVILVFVAAAGFVFGVHAGGGRLPWFGDNASAVADTAAKTDNTIVKADTAAVDSAAADTVLVTDSLLQTDSIKAEAERTAFDTLYYDSIDVRVRLGAYSIVGIADTVQVIQGQTLSSITKAYLGEGMECYIEALNGITEAKPGDTIKIPKLKWKKKRKR